MVIELRRCIAETPGSEAESPGSHFRNPREDGFSNCKGAKYIHGSSFVFVLVSTPKTKSLWLCLTKYKFVLLSGISGVWGEGSTN